MELRKLKMNRKKRLNVVFSTALLLALCSCGKIPSAYRGTFIDQASGTQIVLESSSGTLTEADGRQIKSDANDLQFDALNQAKAGIYLRNTQDNPHETEVFWLVPNASTRQDNASFSWMDSEIIYTRMNSDAKDPVQSFQIQHCKDGTLMLDMLTKTWNGGCPPTAPVLNVVRVKN